MEISPAQHEAFDNFDRLRRQFTQQVIAFFVAAFFMSRTQTRAAVPSYFAQVMRIISSCLRLEKIANVMTLAVAPIAAGARGCFQSAHQSIEFFESRSTLASRIC